MGRAASLRATKLPAVSLPRRWTTIAGKPALWGGEGTYTRVPYEVLPPLSGVLDGSFTWLRSAPRVEDGLKVWRRDEVARDLRDVAAAAEREGLSLPAVFLTCMMDPELDGRVPSCTGCFYDIASRLVELPERPSPGRLLRFLRDQQDCCAWYLLLEPGDEHQVVCGYPAGTDEEPFDSDDLGHVPIPADIAICALDFEEFIKRFWIENVLWFAVDRRERLEGELREYSEAAKAAVARMGPFAV